MSILSPKDPVERVIVSFDFSPALGPGEAVASIVSVSVEVSAGYDPAPEAILSGGPLIASNGVMIQQPVCGGLDGVNYNIKVIVDTNMEEKRLAVTAILPVRSQ